MRFSSLIIQQTVDCNVQLFFPIVTAKDLSCRLVWAWRILNTDDYYCNLIWDKSALGFYVVIYRLQCANHDEIMKKIWCACVCHHYKSWKTKHSLILCHERSRKWCMMDWFICRSISPAFVNKVMEKRKIIPVELYLCNSKLVSNTSYSPLSAFYRNRFS